MSLTERKCNIGLSGSNLFNLFKRKKMENIFDFKTYLIGNNFKQKTPKFYAFGFITIKIIGDRFIAMNFDT